MLPCFSAVGVKNNISNFYVTNIDGFDNEVESGKVIQIFDVGSSNTGILFLRGAAFFISLMILLKVNDIRLNRMISKEIKSLFDISGNISNQVFSYDQLVGLPEPVQRYFKYCLQDGQNYISYARLKHGGTFRMSEEQNWLPITGEEYFTAEQPGFLWFAKVKPLPFFWVTARDMYLQGKGNMLIKLLSTFKVGDASGPEMDYSSLVRYLSELPLLPTALLPSDNISWEEIDNNSARVTISDGDLNASAVVYFNEIGEITRFEAQRYQAVDDTFLLENWTGYLRNYTDVDGMKIPKEFEAVWNLKSGDFSYVKFVITEIEYNKPNRF